MALHYTHDMMNLDTFLDAKKSNTFSWHTSNFESSNEKPSFIRVAAFFPI